MVQYSSSQKKMPKYSKISLKNALNKLQEKFPTVRKKCGKNKAKTYFYLWLPD